MPTDNWVSICIYIFSAVGARKWAGGLRPSAGLGRCMAVVCNSKREARRAAKEAIEHSKQVSAEEGPRLSDKTRQEALVTGSHGRRQSVLVLAGRPMTGKLFTSHTLEALLDFQVCGPS